MKWSETYFLYTEEMKFSSKFSYNPDPGNSEDISAILFIYCLYIIGKCNLRLQVINWDKVENFFEILYVLNFKMDILLNWINCIVWSYIYIFL